MNDNFRRWFGNSKVVDDSGNPLVVYRTQKEEHPHGEYKEYKTLYGIYFSEDKNSTKTYGTVTEGFYLKMENPKILRGIEHDEMWNLSIITKDKYNELMSDGYDGAIWLRDGKMYELVVFDKSKIKSVNNDGTWSDTGGIYS